MQDDTRFTYRYLPSVDKFDCVLSLDHYTEIPDDWYIVIVDIKGSITITPSEMIRI